MKMLLNIIILRNVRGGTQANTSRSYIADSGSEKYSTIVVPGLDGPIRIGEYLFMY